MTYSSPEAEARSEQEVKRSRFIGVALPARSDEDVTSALERLRGEFPDATHHCWAYVIGDPASSPRMRADDDGEPGGTAGRPILHVLTQRGLGDTLAVVVRYFGGVKLGAGGLVRAYSAAASAALDRCSLVEAAVWATVSVAAAYADEKNTRRVIDEQEATLLDASYADAKGVVLTVRLPEDRLEAFREALTERTGGRVRFEP